MKIIEEYINGLKKAYFDNNAKQVWEHFESIIHGEYDFINEDTID